MSSKRVKASRRSAARPRNSSGSPAYYTRTADEVRALLAQAEGYDDGTGTVSDGQAMRVAAVWACVRLLSDALATLPVALYKTDGVRNTLARKHAVNRLLSVRPNNWQTPFEFQRMALAHVLLRGNFYAQKIVSQGRVVDLLPLVPSRVQVKQSNGYDIVYQYQLDRGTFKTFAQDEILHFRGLSVDGVRGLSVLEAARNSISLAVQTETHGRRLFTHGATPSGVLKHPKELSGEAIERLRAQFNDHVAGEENAHKPILLEDGLEWQQLSMTAEDTQFIDSRKFSRTEIAMFFGVPPHMIGDVERGTSWGSGIEQQSLGFLVYTLMPFIINFQQALVRDLLKPEEQMDYVVKYDTAMLTRADFKTRQDGLAIMRRNGVISANDWRKVEGLDPIQDEAADDYLADQTLTRPSDQSGASEEPAQPDPLEAPPADGSVVPAAARFLQRATRH